MKKHFNKTLLLATLGTTLALTACTSRDNNAESNSVELHHCVIQEKIPGSKATGAFLSVHKHGKDELSLVSAELPTVTSHVEIHEMTMKNGKMKMQQIKEYPLTEGDNVFKKGGYHIMLMDLTKDVAIGETHKLTLKFSDGSSKSCSAEVKSVKSLMPKNKKGMKTHKHQH